MRAIRSWCTSSLKKDWLLVTTISSGCGNARRSRARCTPIRKSPSPQIDTAGGRCRARPAPRRRRCPGRRRCRRRHRSRGSPAGGGAARTRHPRTAAGAAGRRAGPPRLRRKAGAIAARRSGPDSRPALRQGVPPFCAAMPPARAGSAGQHGGRDLVGIGGHEQIDRRQALVVRAPAIVQGVVQRDLDDPAGRLRAPEAGSQTCRRRSTQSRLRMTSAAASAGRHPARGRRRARPRAAGGRSGRRRRSSGR